MVDPSRFPQTRRSVIVAAASADAGERERAWQSIVAAYWKPAYKYIRLKWPKPVEDAEDLTQGFFAAAIEKSFLRSYDAAKGSFRNFLRVAIDGYVANQDKAARRLKRGGEATILSLDFQTAEGEFRRYEIPDGISMEDYFHKEWVRGLFGLAVERLRQECEAAGKRVHFEMFRRYDLSDPQEDGKASYDALAAEYGLPVTTVTNHLAWARRQFRRAVLDILREITANDREFRSEARAALGVDAP